MVSRNGAAAAAATTSPSKALINGGFHPLDDHHALNESSTADARCMPEIGVVAISGFRIV
jgi:hypothetical protein